MKKLTPDPTALILDLDKQNFTAKITGLNKCLKKLIIPRSVIINSQEYIITSLSDDFGFSCKVNSILFPDDSEIRTIGGSFSYSNVQSIKFSSKLEKFKENWCSDTSQLTKISIPPSNPHFIYLDQSMILGKSNPNDDTYDTLIFARRNIEKAIIPNFVKYISPFAFSECKKLKEIVISENSELRSIGSNAFNFSIITNFYIPSHLEVLEDSWCNHLSCLTNISISPENKNYKHLDNDNQIVVGKSDKSTDLYDVLVIASRSIHSAFIPSQIKYISSCAFLRCSKLEKVDFSEDSNLISIGESAFFRCPLLEVMIPRTVKMIGKSAFIDTEFLKTVDFGENSELLSIEDNLFTGSGINKVFIPTHVKRIGNFSFSSCSNLSVVEFAQNSELTEIGDSAFSYDNLDEIIIPKHVQVMGRFAFFKCSNLRIVEFEEGSELYSMGPIIFSETIIENITIPKGVTEIKERSFMNNSNLISVDFPDDSELTTICSKAFVDTSIESITFPSKLKTLMNNWCLYTSILTNISLSPLNKNFVYLDEGYKLIVGKSDENVDVYDAIVFSSRDMLQIVIPSYIKVINTCAFSDCEYLEKVEFCEDSELTLICESAFSGSSLTSIVIPRKVRKVEQNTFILCPNLVTAEFLGDDVTVGSNCFENCSLLIILSFPNTNKLTIVNFPFYFVSEYFSLFISSNSEIERVFDTSMTKQTQSEV